MGAQKTHTFFQAQAKCLLPHSLFPQIAILGTSTSNGTGAEQDRQRGEGVAQEQQRGKEGGWNKNTLCSLKSTAAAAEFKEMQNLVSRLITLCL